MAILTDTIDNQQTVKTRDSTTEQTKTLQLPTTTTNYGELLGNHHRQHQLTTTTSLDVLSRQGIGENSAAMSWVWFHH